MGWVADELLESSMLQASTEGVVRQFQVINIAIGQDDCGLLWIQVREDFISELLDLVAASKAIDIDDNVAGVRGLNEGAVL